MVNEWLRPLLSVDTRLETDEFLSCIFDHFRNVYYSDKRYCGKSVRFQIFGQLNIHNPGFLHFVTHDSDHLHRNSSIDINRSLRIHWIEDILKNHLDSEILIYTKLTNRENRIHILLKEERYILVIAYDEAKGIYLIRTAFYIDSDGKLSSCLRDYRIYKTNMT